MTNRILMLNPKFFVLLLALVIMVPIVAQDEGTAATQAEDKPVVQE